MKEKWLIRYIAFITQKKMKKEAVIWPAEDIKWEQLKGGPPGVMIANLWGNYEKGARA